MFPSEGKQVCKEFILVFSFCGFSRTSALKSEQLSDRFQAENLPSESTLKLQFRRSASVTNWAAMISSPSCGYRCTRCLCCVSAIEIWSLRTCSWMTRTTSESQTSGWLPSRSRGPCWRPAAGELCAAAWGPLTSDVITECAVRRCRQRVSLNFARARCSHCMQWN